ncbi:MAG TPA: hypothetical protein VL418_13825 [Devosiaceae bacterium]|nr:hypothetical protein [Devosiaceae bacterium]
MQKTYLLFALAAASITLGAASAAYAQPVGVTCPIGRDGIEYRYIPQQNICVPVRTRAPVESRTTPQSYTARAVAAPQVPASTLASGDGSGG